RGDPAPDPAAHSRQDHVRATHGTRDSRWLRATGRRVGHWTHYQHGSLSAVRGAPAQGQMRAVAALAGLLVALAGPLASAFAAGPEGTLTIARTESTVARWFDPADMDGGLTGFFYLYALHDALVKPLPGNALAPCLAEAWSTSSDGLAYEFVLRKGVRFHNGDQLTVEDVKFSFERYRGAAAGMLKDRVASVDIVDPTRIRFRL